MDELLVKLIASDIVYHKFANDKEIIKQGMAPILAEKSQSITIQKANLLEQAKHHNWQIKAKQLFTWLHQNSIRFIVFKGFAFTHLLYNHSNIRPYTDIDILINKNDYDRVYDILIKLNYHSYPSRCGKFVSFQNSFFDSETPQTIIDLHWQINNRIEFHQYFPFKDLIKDAIRIKTREFEFHTLGTINAVIIGCFHYQAHRPKDRKHIWLYDLAILWSNMNEMEQATCINKAKQTMQLTIVQTTLMQIFHTFENCFANNLEDIEKQQEPTENYLLPRNKKITDINIRLKNIKGIKNKIKFLSEYIFQSHTYVQNRYNLNSTSWIYLYYPKMWIQDILKLFKP
ncbi:hypothetical protein MNBD_GAMMA01-1584 [hydrothermal vent metagenome]|uniref:Nucleotidyltransferase family protein n=1 Tax=hydrothermal vent metagenome TaxID=652676 RepID=A0A3B0UXV3_9ZZZZ